MSKPLQLYTYFGCKRKVIDLVWQAWGPETTLVSEAFAGTAVVSLNRPDWHNVKNWYLNDYDCHIANVLRSVRYHPEEVVQYAAHPRLEIDLHMIHDYLYHAMPSLRETLRTGIEVCDPQLAGWWVWGMNNWLGGSWCACPIKADALAESNGDLDVFRGDAEDLDGTWRQKLNNSNPCTESLRGTRRNKLSNGNRLTESLEGTARKKLNARNRVTESLEGTKRQKLNARNCATESLAENGRTEHIRGLVSLAYERLRDTTVLCGDFERVLTHSYLSDGRPSGVLLDPPYPGTNLTNGATCYTATESAEADAYQRALNWFLEHYYDKDVRTVLCSQESNLVGVELPEGIRKVNWSRGSGYASGGKKTGVIKDRHTEVLLLSEACHNV